MDVEGGMTSSRTQKTGKKNFTCTIKSLSGNLVMVIHTQNIHKLKTYSLLYTRTFITPTQILLFGS